jgi:hypothetical protein
MPTTTDERPLRGLDDATLDARYAEADRARDRHRERRRRPFVEDGHDAVRRVIGEAQAALRQMLVDQRHEIAHSGGPGSLRGIADLVTVGYDARVAEMLHDAMDAAPRGDAPGDTFMPETREAWLAEMDRLHAEVAALDRERHLRGLERMRADLDAQIGGA